MEAETINKNAAIPKSLMSRINFFIFLIAIAVSSVLMSCNNAQGQGGGNSKTERWEYKTLFIQLFFSDGQMHYSYGNNVININSLGEEGWELVSVSTPEQHSSSYLFAFKRKLP